MSSQVDSDPVPAIVLIGASAGGLQALQPLVRALPGDLPAAVFVVMHFPAEGTSLLPHILNRARGLPSAHARDGDPIRPGHLYIGPPNRHLLIERGRMRLVHGPKENRHRPAIDPLFRSAARAYGRKVIGIILSGALDDGMAGMGEIKRAGGLAIVQDPKEAACPDMPRHAMAHVDVDHCARVASMPQIILDALQRLAGLPPDPIPALDQQSCRNP